MAPLVIPIVNRILIPTITRLPITSAYEYLERRFNTGIGSMASVLFVVKALVWSGIIIYTASFAFAEITEFNIFWVIVFLGITTTLLYQRGRIPSCDLDGQHPTLDPTGGCDLHSRLRRLLDRLRPGAMVGYIFPGGKSRHAGVQLRSDGPYHHRRNHAQYLLLEYLCQRRRSGRDSALSEYTQPQGGEAIGVGLCLVQFHSILDGSRSVDSPSLPTMHTFQGSRSRSSRSRSLPKGIV